MCAGPESLPTNSDAPAMSAFTFPSGAPTMQRCVVNALTSSPLPATKTGSIPCARSRCAATAMNPAALQVLAGAEAMG